VAAADGSVEAALVSAADGAADAATEGDVPPPELHADNARSAAAIKPMVRRKVEFMLVPPRARCLRATEVIAVSRARIDRR
jgi:hypothetical protein